MTTPNQTNPLSDFLPDLPNYDPEPADGVRVGESPVPGLTLKRILRGHTGSINRIAWSPDGRFLASPSYDKTIRIWDVARGKCTAVLEGHEDKVNSVAWSPDGRRLASGSDDKTIRIWDAEALGNLIVFEGHQEGIQNVVWSPDGEKLALRGRDECIYYLDFVSNRLVSSGQLGITSSYGMVWSPDSKSLALGSYKGVHLYDEATQKSHRLGAAIETVSNVAWASSRPLLAASGFSRTIAVWNTETSQLIQFLEGHTESINAISFSKNDFLFVSKSRDKTVRIWRTDTWSTLAAFEETHDSSHGGLAFHPAFHILATLGEKDTVIRIWDIDPEVLLGQTTTESVRYTSALSGAENFFESHDG
ncbi:WD40 repeat domain-containing protein [Nodosilinea sp. LEGE 07298]|uniref:WD40 repeat domain-containing protein n=1 Tax=Nodosilinea sp. LEGE 07298 TaxID=2777970 RepID=UPI00187FEEA5|nr:WD40 repeat domain-containing protein [Nodosilinea sp. LEGE 07298]MBE9108560.1 WD40 repeat domain-containing protein [Nodosilinea sp. LEGE 07298]